MCNLYSITTNQAAISALFRVVNRYVGNLAPMPGVFPDYAAPIIRTGAEGRELATARWGMPSSSKALMDATKKRAEKLQAKGKAVDFKELLRMEPDGGTTNIRNVKSKHWTRWLGVENRCVVPFNSFSEFVQTIGPLRCAAACGTGGIICPLIKCPLLGGPGSTAGPVRGGRRAGGLAPINDPSESRGSGGYHRRHLAVRPAPWREQPMRHVPVPAAPFPASCCSSP